MTTRAPSAPPHPGWELLSVLWKAPLGALPFAGFFLVLGGRPLRQFAGYWLVACVFAGCTLLLLWVATHVLRPLIVRQIPDPARQRMPVILAHAGAAMLGSVLAAVLVHFTLVPGFLGSARSVIVLSAFAALFTLLFTGIITAWHFWQEALTHARSEQELQLARRIQRSFLLSAFPERPRIDVHAVNVSSREVSGDFYDVVSTGPAGMLVAIADVSGKGVPAALLSSMLQASLRTQAGPAPAVNRMIETINRLACDRTSATGQFATFFLAHVDEGALTLSYTNAGHNWPMVFRRGGERIPLEKGGTVVGMIDGLPFEQATLQLAPGDRVVMYTDGVTEAQNAAGDMFGEDRLYALVEGLPDELRAEHIVEAVLAGVRAFLGETEAGDDITVLALRVRDEAAAAQR